MKAWIEKITLESFKSYGKDRIEIPLGQGFISIVGPNGAGKSNIGDAISFCLGIATAKTLRAKNLSYLIYSKNSDRADYAYVEVHFKNYGLFPLQEEDIVISRKVYQDGRTVFRINGAVVRERNLIDFLSKAGIYENAYNVVLQGDIVRFLKMTPVERRKLLEEIAGIEEYEEKKQKALTDLGEVELKLRELRLLLDEMEVQMERLKEELKRLSIYKDLEERKRELEIKLYLKTAYDLQKSLHDKSQAMAQEEKELERLKDMLREYEERLILLEEELRSINDSLFPHKEKVGRLSQTIENLNQEIEKRRKRIEDLEREIIFTQEQIVSLEAQEESIKREEEELLRDIQGQNMELLELEGSTNLLWKSLKEKEESLRVSLEEMEKIEEKLKELFSRLEETRKELSRMELKIRELELKRERVREDMQRLKEEGERVKSNMSESLMKRENYQKMLKEEERSLRAKREQYQAQEEKLRKIRQEKEEVIREISMLKGRLQSMPPEELPFEDIEGVYGRASSLIRVKDLEYLKAVETAGGGRLSYVVVRDEEVAKKCIQRLKELKWGRLNFIPLSRIREVNLPPYPPRQRGVIDFVVNLLEYDRRFERAVRFIFGDTLLVESFETARALGNAYRMVTLEGELFEKSGVISGGYSEERGELGRAFYLEELNRLLEVEEKLREEEQREERLLKALREELLEKESVIAILKRRLEEEEEANKAGYERLKDIEEKLRKAEEYLQILEQELQETIKKVETLREEIAYLEEKLENLKIKKHSVLIHYKESGVEDIRREYEKQKRKIERLKESIHVKQLRQKELQMERESLRREIGGKLAFIDSAREEIKSIQQILEGLHKRKEETEEELKQVNIQAYELYRKKDRLEEEQRNLQSELGKLKFHEETIREELHRLGLERARLEEKYEESIYRLRELSYEGDVVEVKESYNKLKEELSKIHRELSSLGSVNFKAEEEYKEYEERYKDYQERYKKLKEEKESIKELIQEIERKKLRAFMETFHAIDKNLRRTFSELSPGGKAYMVLEKEDDPFSGGVSLVVKPRGKEVQYLEAISGGEKTLAAISLIFAIQDYRPSPFYYFDEVDAHLDEANARRVGELIKERSKKAQFIVVTLREVLASFADRVIGVSSRGGVSKVFTLENPIQLLTV